MESALGRKEVCVLTNQSGAPVAQGDVVILDTAHAASFVTTTSPSYISTRIGVVDSPSGIAAGASGLIVFAGYVSKINLSVSANIGDHVATASVAKQGTPHAPPNAQGDFAETLNSGTSPDAVLLGLVAGAVPFIQQQYYAPTGLTGATSVSRYVGATNSGAPVSGTFAVGDYIIDLAGAIWICTVAGTPGTWVGISPGGGGGRTLLQELTPTGTTATFSGIVATYKKLIIEAMLRGTNASATINLLMQLNGDTTTTNYRYQAARINNFGAGNDQGNSNILVANIVTAASANANEFSSVQVEILQYANTNFPKIVHQRSVTRQDGTTLMQESIGGLHWNQVSAISQIDLICSAGNYAAGSVLRLYGEN